MNDIDVNVKLDSWMIDMLVNIGNKSIPEDASDEYKYAATTYIKSLLDNYVRRNSEVVIEKEEFENLLLEEG